MELCRCGVKIFPVAVFLRNILLANYFHLEEEHEGKRREGGMKKKGKRE